MAAKKKAKQVKVSKRKVAKQRLMAELEAIRNRTKGKKLRPDSVVAAARNPRTELHKQFVWDNTKAAHEYRLWQARQLIASIEIAMPNDYGKPVPMYVSLHIDRKESGYRAMGDVLNNSALRKELLETARRDLVAWTERHSLLVSLVARVARAGGISRHIKKTPKRRKRAA